MINEEMVDLGISAPGWLKAKLDRLRWRAGAPSLQELLTTMVATYELCLRCEENGGEVILGTPTSEGIIGDVLVVSHGELAREKAKTQAEGEVFQFAEHFYKTHEQPGSPPPRFMDTSNWVTTPAGPSNATSPTAPEPLMEAAKTVRPPDDINIGTWPPTPIYYAELNPPDTVFSNEPIKPEE